MDKQKTVAKEIKLSGQGLHTAAKATVTLKPAEPDSGINFVRVDLPDKPVIRASVENLLSPERSPRRTSVGKGPAEVHTVEHLMAALSGLGIDNLTIEIDNSEVPGLDGCSMSFLEALEKAGIAEQEKERRYCVLQEPVFVQEGASSLVALPSKEFKLSYTLDFNHAFLKTDFLELTLDSAVFKDYIAAARTFCLENESAELQNLGMGQGANYDNTLVVGKAGVIKNTLRFEDEFVRHKMLDLIGDLYLVGVPLKAHVIAIKSGHAQNLSLAQKIFRQLKAKEPPSAAAKAPQGFLPQEGGSLNIEAIMKILPHREPFLFVDKITSLESGKRATGIKNVTINDYFFKGHFPARPVMPGVLIVEAMAQVGGVMMLAAEENRGKLAFFMAMDNVKFRKTVIPGDTLVFEVTAGKMRSKTGQVYGKAFVDGKLVCEAELMFAIVES